MRREGKRESNGTDVTRKWREASEIAQSVKVPAAETDDLGSIAGTQWKGRADLTPVNCPLTSAWVLWC